MDIAALQRLSYGLYVVGVRTPEGFGGCVVDAVAQVSAGDCVSLVLACMNRNYTNERIRAEGEFSLSVLTEDVDPFVVANFGFQSSRKADKWSNAAHEIKDNLPLLKHAGAWLRCGLTELREFSTHTLFICLVKDALNGPPELKPLIFGDYQKTMKSAAFAAFKAFTDRAGSGQAR